MKVTPVARYSQPSFPTSRVIEERPDVLRLVPKRWQKNPVVLAALTGVALLASSGRGQSAQKPARANASKVAPVFQHGWGRAFFGGTGQRTPTALLSEDEAAQVINEEAGKAGIDFDTGKVLRGIQLPVTDRYWPASVTHGEYGVLHEESKDALWQRALQARHKTHRGDLALDGTDQRHRISFEFVSEGDFEEWERKWDDRRAAPTGCELDLVSAALGLRHCLHKAKPEGYVAVFYDPLPSAKTLKEHMTKPDGGVDRDAEWNAMKVEAKETAREQLREQVRDFIKWLKAEGVI